MELISQTDFAKLVGKSVSRINLLIKMDRIKTKKIAGKILVINNERNRVECEVVKPSRK